MVLGIWNINFWTLALKTAGAVNLWKTRICCPSFTYLHWIFVVVFISKVFIM